MISLQNRLTLSYALFISAALGILSLVINQFTDLIFTAMVKENIIEKNSEIVRSMGELYNPMARTFDVPAIEAIGMLFVHEGYIVRVEDTGGIIIWDARSCDMQQCADVINNIALLMEEEFQIQGAMQEQYYPVQYRNETVGTISIETYGPFFYSETEKGFLSSINRLLIAAGIVCIILSIIVSLILARTIVKPIVNAKEAARKLAQAHGSGGSNAVIRIDEGYKTVELHELSRSINALARELEDGERRQKQLSADVAHELRTPLTCLQGTIEAMMDGVFKPDAERLASCHEEILRLSRMVQDLNTLSGLEWETSSLHKTDFDLAQLLQTVAKQFESEAREKGIALELDLRESLINADYDRLKQVFINLLSNALKYTDLGSITIALEQGPKYRHVSVADTGRGIPEASLPHVFERFYRADKSRNRSSGGAGIGLSIAAAIVAAHGGTITVESRTAPYAEAAAVHTGTVFHVFV
ncbi:MAG: HAMP domain-containing protein [Treponema sp.]|nr:HAMP domain-containing protein [Treponema sp.]